MSAGPSPARARSAAQVNAAAIASGSVPSIVVPGIPYPAAFSANTRTAELSGTGVDSAVWLFSRQKMTGSLRAAHRLIASCHSPSDEPPSPMNATPTRSFPPSLNARPMPATVRLLTASGAAAGRMPLAKSPTCRSRPFIGGPGLAHLRAEDHAHGLAARDAWRFAAPTSRMIRRHHIALPGAVGSAIRGAALEAQRRRIDRLLSRAIGKPFPWKGVLP
jgi:hypothetical protein